MDRFEKGPQKREAIRLLFYSIELRNDAATFGIQAEGLKMRRVFGPPPRITVDEAKNDG